MNRFLMQDCLDFLRLLNFGDKEMSAKTDHLIQSLKSELGKIEDDPNWLLNNYYSFHSKQMAAYFNMVKHSDEMINQLTDELIKAKKKG